MGIVISISDYASPMLQRFIDGLDNRSALHRFVGKRAQNTIRDYLIGLAATRHRTATSLGAQPTGHLAEAAEKVSRTNALEDTGDGVAISLEQPGMRRAFEDVEIRPGPGKKYLTIPARSEAYGNRAYRFDTLEVLFGKNGPYALAERAHTDLKWRSKNKVKYRDLEGSRTVAGGMIFYWLVKSVSQEQDRSLLPSNNEIAYAGASGARDYVSMLIDRNKSKL